MVAQWPSNKRSPASVRRFRADVWSVGAHACATRSTSRRQRRNQLITGQITAAGWYVAHPELTVAEITRLKRIGKAVDELLDKLGN